MKYSFPTGKPKLNPNSGQAEGLLAWYPITKLDTAKQLIDHSGRGHDALATGLTDVSGTVRGVAADFTSATAKHYQADITAGAVYTVCARYYGVVNKATAAVFAFRHTGSTQQHVVYASFTSDNLISTWDNTNGFLKSTVTVSSTLNSWIDIVLVVDGASTNKLYISGELEATDVTVTSLANAPDVFIFGADSPSSGSPIEGYLKDVRIYEKALTAAEVFAYTNPATRYDLWTKPNRSRNLIPSIDGVCVAPVPIVLGTVNGGACIAPLPTIFAIIPIDGTGTSAVQAALPIILGNGFTGEAGTGAVQTLLPIALGAGDQETYGSVVSPLPAVVGSFADAGIVTTRLPTVAGVGFTGFAGTANIGMPFSTSIAALATGEILTGIINAPLNIVTGTTGSSGTIQATIPVVAAIGLTGRVGTGVVNNVRAQVASVSSQEAFTVGEAIPASFVVFGEMLQGTLNIGSVQNRLSVISGRGLSGGIGTGALTLPLFDVNATFISEVISAGEILLPLPIVRGTILVVLANSVTWVLNTENNRTTNYTQFPFTALGLLGTNPVGVTADGIYLLTGDNDNGQAIDAAFAFGMTDFRNELVNNADVYIGGDIEGDMELSIREDGQEAGNTYTLSEREQHVRGHRAKLGKGFRSRYREISLSNVNGGNFDLDSLSLSSRDLRGNE